MAPEWKPRSKRKRWARKGPTPNELFPALSTTPLFGLLDGRFVWVPADDRTAKLLDGACFGTPAGGARSAVDAAGAAAAVFGAEAVFSAAVSESRGGPRVCVRLSLEEAVFLVHVLGTLRVVVEEHQQGGGAAEAAAAERGSGGAKTEEAGSGGGGQEEVVEPPPARVAREMDGEELWRYACLQAGSGAKTDDETDDDDDDEAFLRSYAAFHHFRCKGWTVRSGLRYGCDFVLYQGHPAASHADVCVLAVRRGGCGGEGEGRSGGDGKTTTTTTKKTSCPPFFTARESPSRQAGPLTWLDVEIGNRLAAQVGKRLLLLHVQVDRGGGGEEGEKGGAGAGEGGGEEEGAAAVAAPRRHRLSALTAAEALSRVTVEERLVERWVPDVDREEPVV